MLKKEITMPKLGESVIEGTIVKWLVKAGDQIKLYQNILEVETDKVVAEVPAAFAGTLLEILAKEGDTLPVGSPICVMQVSEGGKQEEQEPSNNKVKVSDEGGNRILKNDAIIDNKREDQTLSINTPNKARCSPVVRSLINQHNINIANIQGSGEKGRITRKDILLFINENNKPSTSLSSYTANKSNNINLTTQDQIIKVTPIRRAIANKMQQSSSNIPHAWMSIEVDATNLVKLRQSLKDDFFKQEGIKLTYFPFFVEEIVKALKKYPILNSSWNEDVILIKKDINISIAIGTDKGLFVPVIKNVDSKNYIGIAKSINDLASKAKSSSLTVDDMSGGTFTINNTGVFGSNLSQGIINYPQVAILQVESVKKKPVILNNNSIAIRDLLNICLSFDHRVLDGLEAGRFLQEIKYNIESIK